MQGLQKLNALGYGKPGSGLKLDLVYNPGGPFLAPSQAALEPAYKQELNEVGTYEKWTGFLLCVCWGGGDKHAVAWFRPCI
jgi:hypothetical protein